jgi:excisionase family DNA binding protein
LSSTQNDRWLTVSEAAATLNVSPKTIRRRLADGTIPAMRLGRLIRINPADLTRAGCPVQYMGGGAA